MHLNLEISIKVSWSYKQISILFRIGSIFIFRRVYVNFIRLAIISLLQSKFQWKLISRISTQMAACLQLHHVFTFTPETKGSMQITMFYQDGKNEGQQLIHEYQRVNNCPTYSQLLNMMFIITTFGSLQFPYLQLMTFPLIMKYIYIYI